MTLSKRTHPYLLVVALVLAVANAAPVAAQGEQPGTPGIIAGTGTHFEVADSDWLNVTVDSSAEINLFLISSPEIVNMTIEAASGATSAEITLGGLEANTTYWKYKNGGVDGVEFAADASGNYTFTQDLSKAHDILIQPGQGTVNIDNTGAGCTSIGTWDPATQTCTLTQDVNDSIHIITSGVTLDGAGHQVNLPSWGWVQVRGANHTVKNLTINGLVSGGPTGYGVLLFRVSYSTVANVTVANSYYGIRAYASSNNTISDNTISGAAYGIFMYYQADYNTVSGNTFSPYSTSHDYYGVCLHVCSGNTITGNTISNFERGLYIYGDYHEGPARNNTVYRNNFVDNTTSQIELWNPSINIGNVFHRAEPDGGNYYTVFDEPDEGCSDGNGGDGFCDSPYTFSGGQDDLPWTTQDGWEGPTDETPPEITPNVSGTLGNNGWYVSDVAVSWTVTDPESEVSETNGCDPTTISADTASTTLTCTATSAGGTASESVTIKRDATAPTASASASPGPNANGWNNTDVTVSFSGSDSLSGLDSCSAPVTLSSEGAGQSASGTCTDLAGNSASATASGINIDKTPPTLVINTPQPYDVQPVGTLLDFSASDALSGLAGPAVATVTSGPDTWDMASGEELGVGVYTVVVAATDLAGNTATSEPHSLVIYDPAGGFVTSGGWINSPEGAYPADPTLTGKANFGFASKYKKGKTEPEGNTEFQFKAGDLNFHSNSYDWLVIAGAKAKYKGVGTINGGGNYGFMLTATDADLTPSTDVDLFRIKIWDKDNGDVVVYDNKMGELDDSYAGTPIGGGNIKIHKAK